MPIKVNIKKKAGRFERDLPKYHAVVSGPHELFTPQIERLLELNGLAPYKDATELAIWSSMPQIGGPPTYLAHLLAHRFKAVLHRDCRDMAFRAVEERQPEDGLEHILGATGSISPGKQKLHVDAGTKDFIANCDEDNFARCEFLEAAGWIPFTAPRAGLVAKFGTRPYRTRDPFMAGNLDPFMSKRARALLKDKIKAAGVAIRRSKSQDASDAMDIPTPEGLDFFDFQKKGITIAMESEGGCLIADDMGLGKAQPLDAKILTPTGWMRMGDIKAGQMVIGSDGQATEVTGVYPQGEKEIFEVTFSDGATTECCDEHLWSVISSDGSAVVELSAIREDLYDAQNHPRFAIPLMTAYEGKEMDLGMPAYELGSKIAQDMANSEDLEHLLLASKDQRLAILQGLMDSAERPSSLQTCGWYVSTNRLHLQFVKDLVRSLGGTAHDGGSGPSYDVIVYLPEPDLPYAQHDLPAGMAQPQRFITRVAPLGEKQAQCIAVAAADHLYVTDDYVVTHNTMQGIGVINASPEANKILVVCQANMRIKWAREIEKWKVRDNLSVGYAEGSKFPDTDVVVINYDIVDRHLDSLMKHRWDIIIPDEAHNLKNHEAKRTLAILGDIFDPEGQKPLPLSDIGKMVHLTGTPRPNRISEMWPLLTSSRPDLWGRGPEAAQVFNNRYCPPILIERKMKGKGGKDYKIVVPMPGKPVRETELQLRLRGSGSFVRRLKRDTPDLPPKFRTPLEIPVRLSKEEKDLLRQAEADLMELTDRVGRAGVKLGESEVAGPVINAISRMDPDTPQFHEMARVRRNVGLIKAPHCARFIVDELEAEKDFDPEMRTKSVVFAHHKEVIETIYAEAQKRMKGSFLIYDGSVTSAKKRQAIVDRFQEDDDIRGIIISLAGATGITLTAAARMRVVEPDWSPSNMIQIEDRIWRIGQERNVDIGYLSMAGTLDARVGNTLAEKMESDEKTINTIKFQHTGHANKAKCEKPREAKKAEPVKEKDQMEMPI